VACGRSGDRDVGCPAPIREWLLRLPYIVKIRGSVTVETLLPVNVSTPTPQVFGKTTRECNAKTGKKRTPRTDTESPEHSPSGCVCRVSRVRVKVVVIVIVVTKEKNGQSRSRIAGNHETVKGEVVRVPDVTGRADRCRE